ncbi:hypothetical protein QYF61_005414 [Mycteria americana]|uniref:Uncharacterized protein n=1 Tax=Mycteria americana TaxID=33587 RepID=A0AAN7MTC3_MYCAM|nr:hypothetical protein QYF61_005414 [Mycteria americana]
MQLLLSSCGQLFACTSQAEVELMKEAFHAVSFENSVRSSLCQHFLLEGFFIDHNTDAIINPPNGLKRKSGKEGRRPAQLRKDLLVKLKSKKEMQRQWNQTHVSWEEYMDPAWICRDGIRKAKAQLELNLARDAKKKKRFYKYIGQERKIKEKCTERAALQRRT